jgi:hypothetical protein
LQDGTVGRGDTVRIEVDADVKGLLRAGEEAGVR